jgi:hypothetical protein
MERERGEGATTFLVERYWPGVTADALAAAVRRGKRVAEAMTQEGTPVRYLSSTLVPNDELVLCLFEAASAEAVSELSARAEMPVDRIVEAVSLVSLERAA